ncbi:Uncharacterized protein dnm_000400 [Desulfonema magnum]|uniref:Uncharacterized protein n=1 Tax=Desulfonema magnum TaxID=45655 RepID=A0A975BEW3_9BACT|nr:Uncharacterized protein dnm_000400 [Desulfonema magnum]
MKYGNPKSKATGGGHLGELSEELGRVMSKRLCKQKRKRKTTRQLLEARIPYYGELSVC